MSSSSILIPDTFSERRQREVRRTSIPRRWCIKKPGAYRSGSGSLRINFGLAVPSIHVAYASALVGVSELQIAPFLHCSFVVGVVGTHPSAVKVTLAVDEPALAVLVNVPHSVGVATMVSVKGCVSVKKCPPGHVTVFLSTQGIVSAITVAQ